MASLKHVSPAGEITMDAQSIGISENQIVLRHSGQRFSHSEAKRIGVLMVWLYLKVLFSGAQRVITDKKKEILIGIQEVIVKHLFIKFQVVDGLPGAGARTWW